MRDWFSIERDRHGFGRSRKFAGAAGQGSVKGLDFEAACCGERAPGGRGGPETCETIMGDARHRDDGALRSVIAETAEGEDAGPGGHGAGVVMAAFGFIPRIALQAVV